MPSRNYPKPAFVPAESMASPAKTKDTGEDIAIQSLVQGSADASPLPDSPAASSKAENEPPLDPSSSSKLPWFSTVPGDSPAIPVAPSSTALPSYGPQKLPLNTRVPSYSAVPGRPLASSLASSSSALGPPLGHSQQLPLDPKVPNPSPLGRGTQTQTQGIGAIIYNAFGKQGPDGDKIASTVHTLFLPAQMSFTIDAQTFTANPTGFIVNSAAISPGGTPHIIDGTIVSLNKLGVLAVSSNTLFLTIPSATPGLAAAGKTFTPNPSAFSMAGTIISTGGPAIIFNGIAVSLDQSGVLVVESATISLPNPSPKPPTTEAFTVAGQTFTPNPSVFPIDGTTVSVDGPAATISGTAVSLGQDGVLMIGSSTVSLLTPSYIHPSQTYTVAGQTFTPNPSAFSIAGTTISAGGPAATVDGTVVSLGQSGALRIGSSTISLPTQSYTPSKAYTVAGQTFTPNPSAFPIATTVISAAGPAATVNGLIISLQPSGILLIGPSTIPLLMTPALTSPSSDIEIDGFDVKAESPSIVIVNGTTLTAGAAGVTLSGGKALSLEAGGATLDIGTGRFALPTTGSSPANGSSVDTVKAFTGAGQGKGKGTGLSPLLLVLCGICGTFSMLLVI